MKRERKDKKKDVSLETATTNDVVAPWWNVPIEEQHARKEEEMRKVLKRCSRRIYRKDNPKVKMDGKNRIGSVKKPCPDFLNGCCLFGNRCKFLHMTMEAFEAMQKEKAEGEVVSKGEGENALKGEGENALKGESENALKGESENTPKRESENTPKETVKGDDSDEYEKEPEEGQLCTMLSILSGTENTGYRNKCSFTIGLNKQGEKCVGFRMGNFINGNVCVGEVE